jgi:hypothetical protein
MTSYLAVIFFCAGDCYFWSSKQLHSSEASCQREVVAVVKELEKAGAEPAFQCIKVPLVGA